MQRDLFGLSLGFVALILLTTHASHQSFSFPSRLPTASAATPQEAPR